MEAIDLIKINFDESKLVLLNWCLGFLMFGVALDIQLKDFKELLKSPKVTIVALTSQLFLLPLLTLSLVFILNPGPSLALGMILLGVCPGGNVSNYMVHIAKANTALSVTLTSITTLSAIIITPLAFWFWMSFLDIPESMAQEIKVDPLQMFKTISLLIALPLFLGLGARHYFSDFVVKIKKGVGIASMLIFLSFVVFAILGNLENIQNHVVKVFWIVLFHNALGFLMGFGWAQIMGLKDRDVQTVSIETGIQNSGLGLILIFNFFGG